MKTFRKVAFAFLALAAFACSKPEAPENSNTQDDPKDEPTVEVTPEVMTFSATLESAADAVSSVMSKVTFNGTGKSLWEADDKICVYDGEDVRYFEAEAAGETTDFTGSALEADVYYAHYPYSDAVQFQEGAILTTIPASQTAVKYSFDPAAAIAVATAAKDADLAFKNITSMLAFSVPAEVVLTSVSLKGNAEEKIAGDVSVTFGQDGLPVLADAGNAASAVTLVGEMTDGVYYVLVRPGDYSGLTAVLTYEDGETYEVSLDEPVTLNRSAYRSIGEVPDQEEEPVEPDQPGIDPDEPNIFVLGLAATLDELDPESKAAALWALSTFPNAQYLQIAKIPETDLSQCDVMWWHFHKDWGLDEFAVSAADAVNQDVMDAVKAYRNAGGALFLSRYATYWAAVLDMVGGEWKYPGTIFGGTEAGESGWFCNGKAEFFSTEEVANSVYFAGCTMDANDGNAWKVVANDGEYYYSNQHCLYETGDSIWDRWTEQNGNVLLAFENDRKKAVMWECTYGMTEQSGKVVCFGSPLLDFYEYMGRWNEYHDNVYKIAENTLRHLAE